MIITNCYNIALQNNKRNTVYLLMDIQFIHVKPQSWGRKNILQQNTDHVTCMTSLSENRFTMANMGMAWVNVWRKNRNALTASQRASNLLYSERSTIKQQSEYRFFFYQACYCTVANLTMVLPKTLPIWKSPGEKSVHQMSVLQAKEMLHLTKLIRKR